MPAGIMLKAVNHVLHVFTHNSLYTVIVVTVAAVYTLSLVILVYLTGLFMLELRAFLLTPTPVNFKSVLFLALVITVSL